jgi:myo-inositol 2-dehydrogenase/D-chiro-inositol 1-dehydrogenase
MSDTFQAAPGARPDLRAPGHQLRVAVIGAGRWWGRQHARVFAERLDTELVAIVGRDPERTARRAKEVHARAYTDVETMLAAELPDLVSVSLPNREHFAVTLQLVRADVPLLVEKPLVFDLDEADHLLAEIEARGLFVAIDFNHRYARPVQLAAEAIAAGRIGEVTFATWRFGGEGDSEHPDANLIETQCHGFDMLEHLAGPVASVAAEFTERPGRGHSSLSIALRFDSGAVGSLVGSYDSSYAHREAHRVEVNGTAGRILIVDTVRRFELQSAGSETAEVWEAGYFNDLDRSFHRTLDRHVDEVLAALRSGGEPPIPVSAGRRALQLGLASVRSFEEGHRVETPVPGSPRTKA